MERWSKLLGMYLILVLFDGIICAVGLDELDELPRRYGTGNFDC